jgi:glutamate-1-semialdehyde 2,1-aminomutase
MAPGTISASELDHDDASRPTNGKTGASSMLAAAEERFVQRNPKSWELHQKAVKSLPGGNTRSLLHTAPFPLCMKSGKGHELTDEDGHTWVASQPVS